MPAPAAAGALSPPREFTWSTAGKSVAWSATCPTRTSITNSRSLRREYLYRDFPEPATLPVSGAAVFSGGGRSPTTTCLRPIGRISVKKTHSCAFQGIALMRISRTRGEQLETDCALEGRWRAHRRHHKLSPLIRSRLHQRGELREILSDQQRTMRCCNTHSRGRSNNQILRTLSRITMASATTRTRSLRAVSGGSLLTSSVTAV